MLVQPPARRPDVSLYRLGTEPAFFDRAQSMDPQARKTKCRLNTPLTPNPSCEVSGSPTGSRSPPTRRPRKPKPPPPEQSGHHQNSAIAPRAVPTGSKIRALLECVRQTVDLWSLTSLRETLIKIGAKVVSHGRYVAFQLAEVAVSRRLFAVIKSK